MSATEDYMAQGMLRTVRLLADQRGLDERGFPKPIDPRLAQLELEAAIAEASA